MPLALTPTRSLRTHPAPSSRSMRPTILLPLPSDPMARSIPAVGPTRCMDALLLGRTTTTTSPSRPWSEPAILPCSLQAKRFHREEVQPRRWSPLMHQQARAQAPLPAQTLSPVQELLRVTQPSPSSRDSQRNQAFLIHLQIIRMFCCETLTEMHWRKE